MTALSAHGALVFSDPIWHGVVIHARQEDLPVSDQFWLTKGQLKCVQPYFRRSRGALRPDDIFASLSTEGGSPDRLMIDSTHLKVHRSGH
jgi:hypothetical protein